LSVACLLVLSPAQSGFGTSRLITLFIATF
jgi:hypothetical protein